MMPDSLMPFRHANSTQPPCSTPCSTPPPCPHQPHDVDDGHCHDFHPTTPTATHTPSTTATPSTTPTADAPPIPTPTHPGPGPPAPASAHALDLPLVLWHDILALLDNPQDHRALCSTCRLLRPLLRAPLAAIRHLTLASHKDIPLAPLHRLFPAATSLALLSSFFLAPDWLAAFLAVQAPLLPQALALSADLQSPCPEAPRAFAAATPLLSRLRALNLYNLHPPSHPFLAHLPPLAPTLRHLAVSAHPTLNPQGLDAHPTPPTLAPVLPALPLVTHLTLANFPLTPDLAASVARLPALKALVLRATPSTDAAVLALAPAAPALHTLSVSSVLSHPIGDRSTPAAWAALLAAATALQHLTITLPTLPPSPTFLPPSLVSLSLTTPTNPAPCLPALVALTSLSWHGHHTEAPEHEVATAGVIATLTALQKLDLGLLALPAEEISQIHYLSMLTGLTSIQLSHHTHQYCWSPAHLPQWCPPSVTEFNKAATPRASDPNCSPGTPLTPSQLASPS